MGIPNVIIVTIKPKIVITLNIEMVLIKLRHENYF